ncbi:hypothetical protein [Brucella abortus]|uniref:hypothetical protein n=1 Tax=Brucella abortus TaxID=235 RepID=UPI001FFD0F84|nr:hypothetical protein [Brucella abortus]
MSSGIDPVLERHLKPTANFGRVPEEGCFFPAKVNVERKHAGESVLFRLRPMACDCGQIPDVVRTNTENPAISDSSLIRSGFGLKINGIGLFALDGVKELSVNINKF